MLEKKQLRQHYRCLRRSLDNAEQAHAAKSFCDIISQHSLFLDHVTFACYLSYDSELDLMPLIEEMWRFNKQCYLPVMLSDSLMQFVLFEKGATLKKNSVGIYEPESNWMIPSRDLEVVFVPLVAFDLSGNRLGMGGGHYDRAFDFCEKNNVAHPKLVGVAYNCQQHSHLPCNRWDVPLSDVATETGIK